MLLFAHIRLEWSLESSMCLLKCALEIVELGFEMTNINETIDSYVDIIDR